MKSKSNIVACIIVSILMLMSLNGCDEDSSSSENSNDSYYAEYAVVDTGQTACYDDIAEINPINLIMAMGR